MIGATVIMWAGGMVAVALMNVVVAFLPAGFVAYGRWRLRRIADPQVTVTPIPGTVLFSTGC